MTAPKTRRTGAAAKPDPEGGGGEGVTPPPPEGQGANNNGTEGGHEETVEETVRRVLSEVLPDFLDEGPPEGSAGAAGGGAGGGGAPATGTQGTRSVEDHAESVVRAAMDQIRSEGKTEERLEAIEKIVREEAPRTVRRLTKFFWGEPDKAKP